MSVQTGSSGGSLVDTFQTESTSRHDEIVAAIGQRSGAIPWISRISRRIGRDLGRYTVAQLALLDGAEGDWAFALDGRKVGELASAGTGAAVFFSAGQWRTANNDAQVAS